MTNPLVLLSGSSYVIPGPTNIGLFVRDDAAFLIDSGNDKEAGRKLHKLLSENNLRLRAIINTHSNADHIGGNDFLQRKYNCEIWASKTETAFIETPFLESAFLWGGYPIRDLNSKFFCAKPSVVSTIIEPASDSREGMSFLKLPGHFFDMIGIITEDRVFYLGDAMFGDQVLEKYKIPFIFDVEGFKQTLDAITGVDADYFVLSHGDVQTRIAPLAEANRQLVLRVEQTVLDLLDGAKTFDAVLRDVCAVFHIRLDYAQYALVGTTVRSFLSYLYNRGEIRFDFIDNILYWRRNSSSV
jgi:glyoxylase-like metal-dependent hydrolase (beta-lactamase superfamily II)